MEGLLFHRHFRGVVLDDFPCTIKLFVDERIARRNADGLAGILEAEGVDTADDGIVFIEQAYEFIVHGRLQFWRCSASTCR